MELFWQIEMIDELIKENYEITIGEYAEIIAEIKRVAKTNMTKELIELSKLCKKNNTTYEVVYKDNVIGLFPDSTPSDGRQFAK